MTKALQIVTSLHTSTSRDYLGRMQDEKVECMRTAREYGQEFWDGERRFGYGGYHYDGRWKIVAERLIEHFDLSETASILDVGCGKGFLLYELSLLLPKATIRGFDISQYAIDNSKAEIRDQLFLHSAASPLPFADNEFDLVISLGTLHNLPLKPLKTAITEMERVGKRSYLMVESFRNEGELFNLQCWALTCETFLRPESWLWLFEDWGFTGEHEFIYFE